MGKFKNGTLGEILNGSAFEGGNLTRPNSFAVQVTYYDSSGAHTTDAVLSFTGNARSVYSGAGTFSLTDGNGENIPVSLLSNPETLEDSVSNLDAFIKVYDVGEDNFGKTTVDNLKDQVAAANGSIDGADSGTGTGSGSGTGSGFGSGDFSQFGINVVIGGSYAHVAELLYVEPLKASDASVFDDFQGEIKSECSNAIELANSINGALAATGSSAFYSGATASKQVTNLEKASSNAQAAIDTAAEVKSSDVSNIISSYNTSLKAAKELVRNELLVKAANDYNAKNIVYSTNTDTDYVSSSSTGTTTEIDDAGHFRTVTTKTRRAVDDGIHRGFATDTKVTVYRYIKPEGDFSTIEERFSFHSETLPYDKSRIVE